MHEGDKGTGARPPREQSLAPFPRPQPTLEPLAQLLHGEPPRPRRKERKAAVTSVRLKKRVRAVSPGPLQPRHGRLELAPVSTGPWTSAHHHAGPTPPAQRHKLKETDSGIEELSLCDANAERSCSHFWLRSTFPTAEEGPGGQRDVPSLQPHSDTAWLRGPGAGDTPSGRAWPSPMLRTSDQPGALGDE